MAETLSGSVSILFSDTWWPSNFTDGCSKLHLLGSTVMSTMFTESSLSRCSRIVLAHKLSLKNTACYIWLDILVYIELSNNSVVRYIIPQMT